MVSLFKQICCGPELKNIDELTKNGLDLIGERDSLKQQVLDLQNTQNITSPPILGRITFMEAFNILRTLTPVVFLSDDYFSTTSMDEAKKFCIETKVWAKTWTVNDHDCDNFSYAMQGYWSEGLYSFAFGIAWSDGHAFNFFIDINKQLWIVEPQNNNFYTVEQAKAKSTPDGLNYFPFRFAMM